MTANTHYLVFPIIQVATREGKDPCKVLERLVHEFPKSKTTLEIRKARIL